MKKNIWLILLGLSGAFKVHGVDSNMKYQQFITGKEEKDWNESDLQMLNNLKGYYISDNTLEATIKNVTEVLEKRKNVAAPVVHEQPQPVIQQKAQKQQLAGGGYEMPVPAKISYEEAIRKICRTSVADLLNDAKYELYKNAFYSDVGLIEGFTDNDIVRAGNILLAIDAIKKRSPKGLPREAAKIYDDYIQNNRQKAPINREEEDYPELQQALEQSKKFLQQEQALNKGKKDGWNEDELQQALEQSKKSLEQASNKGKKDGGNEKHRYDGDEDVLVRFKNDVNNTEGKKYSKAQKTREIGKLFHTASEQVITDDTMTIEDKVSKLNDLSDTLIDNKVKISIILNKIKSVAKENNIGEKKFFSKRKLFDLFWSFCGTKQSADEHADDKKNALFAAACVSNVSDFIYVMDERLSRYEHGKKQLSALTAMLPHMISKLSENAEEELKGILIRNVLQIDDQNENAWNYIQKKDCNAVVSILKNGKKFFNKEMNKVAIKLNKNLQDKGKLKVLLDKTDAINSTFDHLIETGIISKKDKTAISKGLSSIKVKISKKLHSEGQEE